MDHVIAAFYCYYSYTKCDEMMKAYARAVLKHDLLSVTDGTKKRSDGTPVFIHANCDL